MILHALVLFGGFLLLAVLGVPIAIALGLSGTLVIALANLDSIWFGTIAVPQNFLASISKYPLLALPMFVLVGSVFDRAGVAQRLVALATAVVGRGIGTLPLVAILVAIVLGGISGSGAASSAALGAVMLGAMARAGYAPAFSATVLGSAAATDILIPPSIALVIYSVMVPGVSVLTMFAAGVIPGLLCAVALAAPAFMLSRRHGFGAAEKSLPRPSFWKSLREASWGLAAPVLILGGMRIGLFTPTEAAAVAVAYGILIGMFVHRTIRPRDLPGILLEGAEISAVIMLVMACAGVFAYSVITLGLADPIGNAVRDSPLGDIGTLIGVLLILLVVGMFLDGVSIFLIFVPLLTPMLRALSWDPVWFGILLTMCVAIGQFTPPMAVNLMVSCRLAGVSVDQTLPWVSWFVLAFGIAVAAVVKWPDLALWLPRALGL
ncbi:MAG: TRAP transporter large permease [Ideonella sp.]|nr:TRAP transporter large permease [Ideonella sp.]